MKTMKALLGVLFLNVWGLTFAPNTALAHGGKALEPFIRMRTIQWYDVMWSKDKLNVNDEVVITGKFHVAEDWPRGVPKPDATYLNVSSPGPVFVRIERYLNGQASVSSAALKLGGDYDFKIVLKARLPGRYHLHPFFNLHDAGAVMGPGHWFEVVGDPAAFTNQVKTLDGNVIDMDVIRDAKIRMGVDPLGGAGVRYWGPVAERYGLNLTVVNEAVDPTFRFMTVDWDGRIRMDPSSPYAMQRLVDLKNQFDVAFACDTDHDRHGIVTPGAGLLAPNHYLAAGSMTEIMPARACRCVRRRQHHRALHGARRRRRHQRAGVRCRARNPRRP